MPLGEVALADPLALSRHDAHPDGDRWDTVCQVGSVLLFIVSIHGPKAMMSRTALSVSGRQRE